MEDIKKSIAVTITLNNDFINSATPKSQVKIIHKYLPKLLNSLCKDYYMTLEFTKKGNCHIHGVVTFHDEDLEHNCICFKSCLTSLVYKEGSKLIRIFGFSELKELFDITGWNTYISKDKEKTRHILYKLKLNNDLFELRKNKSELLALITYDKDLFLD